MDRVFHNVACRTRQRAVGVAVGSVPAIAVDEDHSERVTMGQYFVEGTQQDLVEITFGFSESMRFSCRDNGSDAQPVH